MASNSVSQRPRSYFPLTQQYYNCCSQDGYVYFRDTNSFLWSQRSDASGFLNWKISDTEDPTILGDTVDFRIAAGAGGCGMVVPVDCEFLKLTVQWTNNSFVNADQNVYTFTCTPPEAAAGSWVVTLRDKWVINQTTYPFTTANRTFTRNTDIARSESSYTWDRKMSAGDHVILGFYSNDGSLGSPNVTGAITWFFEITENL